MRVITRERPTLSLLLCPALRDALPHDRMEDLSFLDAVASTGCVVSLAHKAAMQSSFPLLKKQNKFSKVLFFGKVMGKVGDYLIAVGIEESFVSGKKFFFW